jgi:octaprenyl-diphosphate synthase
MPPSATEIEALSPDAPVPPSVPSRDDTAAKLLQRSLALVASDLAEAERELGRLLHSPLAIIPEVTGHLAFAGGKRFRPLLCLLAARAAGFTGTARITVAAVGELLHTATLLHDDVIDAGAFRRGRPSARMPYGNGMAVLTGDYCLARALQAVARTGHLVAVQTMADAVTRMAEGEVAQLQGAGDGALDRARYDLVIDRKTAALIAWCSAVAGLVDAPLVEPLRRYGLELGYAFQIADDLLDYRADGTDQTGKDPGQDLREGKMTLPLILACDADPALRAEVHAALEAGPPMSDAAVDSITAAVRQTSAIDEALAIALDHAAAATRALEALPPSPAREALAGVAHYVVRRTH